MTQLEEQYYPAQFRRNYFAPLLRFFKDHLEIDGDRVAISWPFKTPANPELLLILREIKNWRTFIIDSSEMSVQSEK